MHPRWTLSWILTLAVLLPGWTRAAELSVADGATLEVDIHATGHSFTAKLEHFDATLEGDAAAHRVDRATVRFRWAELKTGKDARDKEMMKWAGAEQNPEGRFVLEKLTPQGDGGALQATGTLELAGQSHPISFPVKIETAADSWKISGEATLDHRDWGLKKIRKLGVMSVDPIVKVHFTVPLRGA